MSAPAAPRLCDIHDCTGIHHARGWCNKHYTRWRIHGDPLNAGKHGGGGNVRLGFRQPMDEWEKSHVSRLLSQRMSYREIQRSTGIGYMTVCRFAKRMRETFSRSN